MRLLFLIFALGLVSANAHADLSYSVKTDMPGFKGKGKISVKGGLVRAEGTKASGKFVQISNYAAGTFLLLDAKKKTWVVRPDTTPPYPGMGSFQLTVNSQKLPDEEIRGIVAPHWKILLTAKIRYPAPLGDQTTQASAELWSSSTPYPGKMNAAGLLRLPPFEPFRGTGTTLKGDVVGASTAYAMVPLRAKIFLEGKLFATLDHGNFSTKILPDSLFKVPVSYRQLSVKEWDEAHAKSH